MVKFGLRIPAGSDIRRFAAEADSLPVDYLFVGEHVFFHGPVSNSLIDLSFAAAVTERVELLSAVTLVPLYPPALLAKMAATLAILSDGRFNLGVGVGGEFPAEFEACGVSTRNRGSVTNESLELMAGLWRGDPINLDSASSSQSSVVLDPLPPRRAVPLWVCGRSTATVERAARYGDWWMPYLFGLERFKVGLQRLHERSAELARPRPHAGLYTFIGLGKTSSSGLQVAADHLSAAYNMPFDHAMVRSMCVAGDSAECVAQLVEFAHAGAEAICLNIAGPSDVGSGVLEQLCTEVIPEVSRRLQGHQN